MRDVLARVLDGSRFDEHKPLYGTTLVCGWGSIGGFPVGVLANNGILFSEESQKGAQFVQLANARSIPLLFVQNITGFMVGSAYERGGIIKDGAKLINAVSNSEVPHLTLMVGASYGAGNYGMSGRAYDPRFVFTWPNHRIAVMGGTQLAGVMSMVQRRSAERAGRPYDEDTDRATRKAIEDGVEAQSNAVYASGRMWDDGVIDPRDTRTVLGLALSAVHSAPDRRRDPLRAVPDVSGVSVSLASIADVQRQEIPHPRGAPVISTLLVANRGEIARRVIRGARTLGIRTVAIYSEPDADAPHVAEADRAVALRGSTATETYLDVAQVLAAARATGADAVHPGYGFLSENAAFARACADAGLTWVGPDPASIEAMGVKHTAKALAREAGVPTLPDALLESDDPDDWARAAEGVGFPLLVKASGGRRRQRDARGPRPRRTSPTPSAPPAPRPRAASATTPCSSSACSTRPGTSRSRSSATRTATSSTSASASARSSAGTRRSSRRRRRRPCRRSCANGWAPRPSRWRRSSATSASGPSSSSSTMRISAHPVPARTQGLHSPASTSSR